MKPSSLSKGTSLLPLGLLLAAILALGTLALGHGRPGAGQTDASDAVYLR